MEAILELYARATLVVAAIAAHRSLRQLLTLDQPGRPYLMGPVVASTLGLLVLSGASLSGFTELSGPAQLAGVGAVLVIVSGLLRPVRSVSNAQIQSDSVARDLLRDRSGRRDLAVSALPRAVEQVSSPAGPELILQDGSALRGKPSSSGDVPADGTGVRPAIGSRLVTPNPDA